MSMHVCMCVHSVCVYIVYVCTCTCGLCFVCASVTYIFYIPQPFCHIPKGFLSSNIIHQNDALQIEEKR